MRLSILFLLTTTLYSALGFAPSLQRNRISALQAHTKDRRSALVSLASILAVYQARPAFARYVLDEETGEYIEIEEADWQTTWKQRLDKASSMSTDDVFKAARGAGNLDLKEGPESDASKKRRAMSACRDQDIRNKVGLKDEKECSRKVFSGDFKDIIDAL